MALPVLDTVLDRVYSILRDTDRTFITEDEALDFLVEGYVDLCARLRLVQNYTTAAFSSTGTVTFPSDMVEPIDFKVVDYDSTFVTDDVFFSHKNAATAPSVTLIRVGDGKWETYPALDATYDYALTYVQRPDCTTITIANRTTATFAELTEELMPRVTNYARAHCAWKEGDDVAGNRYFQLYSEGLPGAPRLTRRLHPARIDITPEPGPFGE